MEMNYYCHLVYEESYIYIFNKRFIAYTYKRKLIYNKFCKNKNFIDIIHHLNLIKNMTQETGIHLCHQVSAYVRMA